VDTPPWSSRPKTTPLPTTCTQVRRTRKQFVVQLILGRLFGVPLRYDEEAFRTVYTDFRTDLPIAERAGKLISSVRGRLRDGFKPLLGEVGDSPNYVQIDHKKDAKTYALRLDRAALVARFRL
jgi:hypothetical protein